MIGTKDDEVLTDELDIEKGFNDAIDGLRKSLGQENTLLKAKADKAEDDEEESSEDEGSEEEDEEESKSYRKSIEDTLREEPEAAAAMDVEPFLLQLAKAIDEGIEHLEKAVTTKVGKVEKLVKSIGMTTLASAELQKSTREIMQKIGEQPVGSTSVRRLEKARFEVVGGEAKEFGTREVLEKSRDWVKTGKIDLTEAGMIEGRVNKGLLGKSGDRLDQKVSALMREGEAS
jgi:hypothetical protein